MAEFAKSVKSEFREDPGSQGSPTRAAWICPYDPQGPHHRSLTRDVGNPGRRPFGKSELYSGE